MRTCRQASGLSLARMAEASPRWPYPDESGGGSSMRTWSLARSSDGWAPSGGMVGPDESLWLLELSSAGQVRVRRVMSDGTEQVY